MKNALFIGTHPDDVEIGSGGTLLLLREKGYRCCLVIATFGEQGGQGVSSEELKRIREAEARKSAAILGVEEVTFLGLPDGLTSFSPESKRELISILRRIRPEVVFTHSSEDHFPDHRVVHELSMAAILGAGGPWYPEAEGEPHSVPGVFGYEVWHPISRFQCSMDVSRMFAIKAKALGAHASQVKTIDYVAAAEGLARYRGAMTRQGTHAEVFEVLRSVPIDFQ